MHMPAVGDQVFIAPMNPNAHRYVVFQDMLHRRHGLEGADMAGFADPPPINDKADVELIEERP